MNVPPRGAPAPAAPAWSQVRQVPGGPCGWRHGAWRSAEWTCLAALPQPAVADLVGALGGWPDAGLPRLAADAAGNPLYITELLAALRRSGDITLTPDGGARPTAAAVPGSLPGAITDRLDFLSAARQVLRTAALLGVECTLSDLAAVLGETAGSLAPVLDEARRRRPRCSGRLPLPGSRPGPGAGCSPWPRGRTCPTGRSRPASAGPARRWRRPGTRATPGRCTPLPWAP